MSLGASYLLNVGPDASGVITAEYADRLLRVAEWYNRMEGCLECACEDPFDYGVLRYPCNVNRKNGKTYFHFYQGIDSSAVVLKHYPSVPKGIRLMNTGASLSFDLTYLPDSFDGRPESAENRRLHIFGIDVDALETEPIVIEITWESEN